VFVWGVGGGKRVWIYRRSEEEMGRASLVRIDRVRLGALRWRIERAVREVRRREKMDSSERWERISDWISGGRVKKRFPS
jgi:hypothetical protein